MSERHRAPARASLGRASAVMAVGTAASRLSGFARTVIVVAAIGASGRLADAYNDANTLPNVVYDLLLGGVLSAVVVPVLVRARVEDEDEGTGFAQSLLAVTTLSLIVVCAVAELIAPALVHLYVPHGADPAVRAQAVTFARWFLPQLVFYGLTAVIGAVLNSRGRFGAPTFVPVLNNVVVIATALIYLAMPPPGKGSSPLGLTHGQTLVLAGGTTAGVVVMGLALLPALRQAGVPWRWRTDLSHPGLAGARRIAGWVLVYVALSQVGFLVVSRLANEVHAFSPYSNAYQLFQLPYAVVGVSVVTALLPAMSTHATTGRLDLLRADLSHGLRLAGTIVVPASLTLAVLAVPVAGATLGLGRSSPANAHQAANVLAVLSLGLVPFTIQQLLLRAFYAQQDTRTPALLALLVTAVLVVFDLSIAAADHTHTRVVGLAAGFAVAYSVGAVATARLLLTRLSGHGRRVLRLYVRVTLAAAIAAGAGWTGAKAVTEMTTHGGAARSLLSLAVGGAVAVVFYLGLARRMRVRELEPLLASLRRSGQ
ncbi:MAG TPA: murein biosynthesis integral membrane protein MurJ [Mycobacteriales bacterium]|nr:murein biosynthesis integral membrane protein MurJ [Mycobacteriales bacterium]